MTQRRPDDAPSTTTPAAGSPVEPSRVRARNGLALVLAGAALLAVHPAVAVACVWSGPAWFAMGTLRAGSWLPATAGMLLFGASGLVAVLGLAAVLVVRGRRLGGWLAAAGLPGAALLAIGPFGGIGLASWIPGGGVLVVAVAIAGLALVPRAGLAWEPGDGRLALRGLLASGALFVAFAAGSHLAGPALPNDPWALVGPDLERGLGTAEPFDAPASAQLPGLARAPWAGIHHDAAQTDRYADAPVAGVEHGELRTFVAGGTCASLGWDTHGHLLAVCVGTRVRAFVIDPATLRPLANITLSERPFRPGFFTSFGGGGYMFVDDEDRIVSPTLRGTIARLSHREEGGRIVFEREPDFELGSVLAYGEVPTSALPDGHGRIWFVGMRGTVGLVDPATRITQGLPFPGEDIENSFAVGDDGDAFVVSSAKLRRFTFRSGKIEVAWESDYDTGAAKKPGQTSRASGTTPTLHGRGWVSIADNGDPMAVDVFDRATGARVCHVPVFEGARAATENSLIALGDDLVVENNWGYRLFDTVGGHSSEAGVARVRVGGRNDCSVAWENREARAPSVVSKASAAAGLVLTYTKDASPLGVDAWWITALSAKDGRLVWRRKTGTGVARNNHYAAIYLGPDGHLYVGTAMGILALGPRGTSP
jgi:outer membrane protein assembly factor BamB